MSATDLFPDMEEALIYGLPPALEATYGRTGVTVGGNVPAALTGTSAFVRIQLLDDPDDGITRTAVVDVDVFAGTRSLAYDVAQEIRGVLGSVRALGGVLLDEVATESGPKRVPWDNQTIRRFLATYRISTRR